MGFKEKDEGRKQLRDKLIFSDNANVNAPKSTNKEKVSLSLLAEAIKPTDTHAARVERPMTSSIGLKVVNHLKSPPRPSSASRLSLPISKTIQRQKSPTFAPREETVPKEEEEITKRIKKVGDLMTNRDNILKQAGWSNDTDDNDEQEKTNKEKEDRYTKGEKEEEKQGEEQDEKDSMETSDDVLMSLDKLTE